MMRCDSDDTKGGDMDTIPATILDLFELTYGSMKIAHIFN